MRHTYHHSEFNDALKLLALKREQGARISLCIPTLNEEAHIGTNVDLVRRELMREVSLIDELVVIDSGSSDNTLAIAADMGARTYRASEILPGRGRHRGKGENLWKSLFVLRGDIIVWIDADIKNLDARFIKGLLGPLLTRRELVYSKAFYRRPLTVSDGRDILGGRITELLVRPVLNAFFPEVADFAQPMSGEFAARREAVIRIPFFTENSVDVIHLIDLCRLYGRGRLAEVDLDTRVHRHHDLLVLGERATNNLHALLRRAEEYRRLSLNYNLPATLRQFYPPASDFRLVELTEVERPPMNSIDEYRAAFS